MAAARPIPPSPLRTAASRLPQGAVVVLLLAAGGCQQPGDSPETAATTGRAPTGTAATPASAPTASARVEASAAAGSLLAPDVLKQVCGATCGGPLSSIRVYRDAGGKIARLYRLYGSCSHSPGIYFSADGTQLDLIPERPIVPGSAEAQAVAARHTLQTQGLALTDVVSCSNGKRSAPK